MIKNVFRFSSALLFFSVSVFCLSVSYELLKSKEPSFYMQCAGVPVVMTDDGNAR